MRRLPNFAYHIARKEGAWRRRVYQSLLPVIVRQKILSPAELPFSVFAFSNEASVPEQVRSIHSFLRHVGRPKNFFIVSDGTHSEKSLRLLRAVDSSVSIRPIGENLPPDLPEKFRHYVTTYQMGRQLGLIMSLPREEPAFYVDSDVLFFAGAGELLRDVEQTDAPALYLPDCNQASADPRIFRKPEEAERPVNSGLLFLKRKLDWSLGVERYLALEAEPNFFTNQTIVHLVMHANGAEPFDDQRYVLQLDDQCIYPDRYASPRLVLRHYVNPVRHKFWTAS